MVRDDLLDDGWTDFWLWWRRWRWWRRWCRGTLLLASNDNLVLDHFAFARWRRGLSTADNEFLSLPCHHFPAYSGGWQTPLAISNDKSVFVFVPAIAAVFAVFVLENDVFLLGLAAPGGRSLAEPDLFALNVDFTGPWAVTTASTEDYVLTLDLARWRRSSRSRLVPMADSDVGLFALNLSRATGSSLAVSDADVVSLSSSNAGSRPGTSATDYEGVFFDLTASTRSCVEVLFSALSDYHLASVGAAVIVLVQEVGNAATGITAAAKFKVEFIIASVTAAAVAIEVALALLVELSCRVTPRHGGTVSGERCSEGGRGRAGLETPGRRTDWWLKREEREERAWKARY